MTANTHEKITTAIVLAGGRRRIAVKDRLKYFMVSLFYDHDTPLYNHGIYKPLDVRLVLTTKKSEEQEISLLVHKLYQLEKVKHLKEIIVVGKRDEIENTLKRENYQQRNIIIVDQQEQLSKEVRKILNIRGVQRSSLAHNALLGYFSSKAGAKKKAALFTTVDDVLTTTEEYQLMLDQYNQKEDAAMIYPWVKETDIQAFNWRHRYYLRLYESSLGGARFFPGIMHWLFGKKYHDVRIGRRVASMLIANPFQMKNYKAINTTYYARKIRDVPSLVRYFGKPALSFIFKYFITGDLSMGDINATANRLLKGKVYSYDLTIPLSTLDLDTDKDAAAIIRTYNALAFNSNPSFVYAGTRMQAVRYYNKQGLCFKEIV